MSGTLGIFAFLPVLAAELVDPRGPIENPGMTVVADAEGVQAPGYHFLNNCQKPSPWQAKWIWLGAEDKPAAIERAYGDQEVVGSHACDTSGLDANEAFARTHGFTGTPVLVRGDGAVLLGFRPREFLENWLKGGA